MTRKPREQRIFPLTGWSEFISAYMKGESVLPSYEQYDTIDVPVSDIAPERIQNMINAKTQLESILKRKHFAKYLPISNADKKGFPYLREMGFQNKITKNNIRDINQAYKYHINQSHNLTHRQTVQSNVPYQGASFDYNPETNLKDVSSVGMEDYDESVNMDKINRFTYKNKLDYVVFGKFFENTRGFSMDFYSGKSIIVPSTWTINEFQTTLMWNSYPQLEFRYVVIEWQGVGQYIPYVGTFITMFSRVAYPALPFLGYVDKDRPPEWILEWEKPYRDDIKRKSRKYKIVGNFYVFDWVQYLLDNGEKLPPKVKDPGVW